MATREAKQIRLELPSTSGVECEIRESLGRDEYIITFYQNERQLKSCSISQSSLSLDQMVDLLSDAGVEFFSFSAIFDVGELLINTIKKEFQELVVEVEQPVTREIERIEEVPDTVTPVTSADIQISAELEKKVPIEPGDKLLKKFEMPYSQAGYAGVYYCRDGKYAVVLFQNEAPLVRKKFSKDEVNEDNLVTMISESGIDFLSFSSIYDSAELIQNVILHPEDYIETEKAEEIKEMEVDALISPEEPIAAVSAVEEPEEMIMVDLSAMDVSEYTKAEDFDKFVVKVTDFVNEGQPLPVKEIEIERSGGVVCIILRQMDSWFIRFRRKDGSHSDLTEVKIDQDEIARLINQDIPQISFSYLYDASENVFKAIEQLAKRPMGDVILNVAVGHFLQVIEQYETDGDLKSAAQITEVLLKRFRVEKNKKGILQFGKKLIDYFEEQKKATKVTKLRNTLAEELLEIDSNDALEFVLDSLDTLVTQEKHLNAANLCGLLLDHYLTVKENGDNLQNVMLLGRKQVDIYKRARLPSVLEENALRYGYYAIQQLAKADADQIPAEQKEAYQEDIYYLLDQAFDSQEERKARLEILESLENTLKLLSSAEVDDKTTYQKYVDRLILTLEAQDKKEKALTTTIESAKLLLDSENYVKACEYGNRAIKLFYELNKITEAIDFSLEIVRGLVDIKETSAARDYLKFVENLIDKAYKADDRRRVEKQLIIGDLFGKLGLKDQAKSYIQTALQTIGDAKKREKIVLEHVDELLVSHATLSAQEMVNLELSRLLTEKEQRITEVVRFCQSFIMKLREYQQKDMVFEYMKYCSSLMMQTDHTDYKVLLNFIKDLQQSNEIDRAAFIMNQLITLQNKQQDYTRAIDSAGRFIDYLLENTDRIDLVEYYIQKSAETYREMGDSTGAIERLITFQKQILGYSIELAQRITDLILKELEPQEEYKKSISIVSPLIDAMMERGKFQDAYIFSVQNARYYEHLGDIGKVIQYLEKTRDKFIQYEQFEEANRMTDLILRFGRSHKKPKLAISAMKNYSKDALDRGDTESATKFALEMAALLKDENQGEKALEFLQMIFNTIYESDRESAIRVFQRIMEIRAEKDDFKKIAKKYLEPLIHERPNIQLIEIANQALSPSFEAFFPFAEKLYDDMLSRDEISDEMAEAIVGFVISVYDEGRGEEGDRIANKYATKLMNIEQIDYASRLMAIILERTEKPVAEVIPASFNFIKELISNSLLEGAREYADRVIDMIISKKKFGIEGGRIISAKIAEKFAVYVAPENPDLASEYAYQASTYYRSLNDFEGIVTVYKTLAEKISSPERAIRAYKRGIDICKKFKANKYEAKLLSHLTEFLISSNNAAAIASFQQTLEKYEELQDLDELFNVAHNLLETAIAADNLKIGYTYLDYITRLSTMINKKEDIGGIIVFLLRHAEEVKDTERVELVQKYIDELGIKPRKYKKGYAILAEQRMAHVEAQFGKIEAVELEEVPEPVPELVETEAIVPPTPEVVSVEPVQEIIDEMIDEKIDEEFVSLIEEFGQEMPKEPQVEAIQPLPPSAAEVPQPEIEVTREIPPVSEDKIVEPPPLEEPEVPQKPALTDDEISALFSITPAPSEPEIPLESLPQPEEEILPREEVPEAKLPALSEDEMDSLFIPKETPPPTEVEQPETIITEEKILEEDEWEVDSFGRLLKKEPLTPSTEEFVVPEIETEELPIDLAAATPDLTPLEKIILEEEGKLVVKDVADDILEETVREPPEVKVEDEEVSEQLPELFKALTLEEETEPAGIFDVPQVDYQEITPNEEAEESKIQTPDLADLFSDALSELGSISGTAGEPEEDKKKKKKK